MKKRICIVIFIIAAILMSNRVYGEVDLVDNNTVKAQVVVVKNEMDKGVEKQSIKAVILEGNFKNQQVIFERTITKYSNSDFKLFQGSEIYVLINVSDNKLLNASLAHVSREKSMTILATIFLVTLLLFGMSKGIRAAISLIFAAFMIIQVYIPWVIEGKDPISSVIIIAFIVIVVSFVIIGGISKKTLTAILGTMAGTLAAGMLAAYFNEISYITGLQSEGTRFLVTELGVKINFKGLLSSGIILGAMGAVMDVSMSISSVLYEIKEHNARVSVGELMASGLSVGRDMMATMVNTLILAYAGASLSMFVLFSVMQFQTVNILNSETIAVEIIRSLCGSIGLILTVPFTSFIGAFVYKNMYSRKKKRRQF